MLFLGRRLYVLWIAVTLWCPQIRVDVSGLHDSTPSLAETTLTNTPLWNKPFTVPGLEKIEEKTSAKRTTTSWQELEPATWLPEPVQVCTGTVSTDLHVASGHAAEPRCWIRGPPGQA